MNRVFARPRLRPNHSSKFSDLKIVKRPRIVIQPEQEAKVKKVKLVKSAIQALQPSERLSPHRKLPTPQKTIDSILLQALRKTPSPRKLDFDSSSNQSTASEFINTLFPIVKEEKG